MIIPLTMGGDHGDRRIRESFSKRMRARISAMRYGQEELANEVGVSRTSITNMLASRQLPRLAVLVRLADALNTSTDYLLGRKANP